MAKFILKDPSEDDPIFGGGFVISSPRRIPKSKKSKPVFRNATDEQNTFNSAVDIKPCASTDKTGKKIAGKARSAGFSDRSETDGGG